MLHVRDERASCKHVDQNNDNFSDNDLLIKVCESLNYQKNVNKDEQIQTPISSVTCITCITNSAIRTPRESLAVSLTAGRVQV